jgi:Carboxypeptidase regulatory-like domain
MTQKLGLLAWTSLLILAIAHIPASGEEIAGNGVVGAAGLLGQVPQSNQAPSHTVRGIVVNSVTGEPIYRALVQIGGQYAMLTDHEGHFEFDGVTLQGIPPWAMKPGYFAQDHFGWSTTVAADNASAQPDTESLVIKLVPEAIISGTVTGQDGAPLEGIPVQLKTLAVQDGLSHWRQRQGTRTNSDGQYRFAELEAGKYAVSTGFHTEGLADSQSALGYVPARYPPAGAGSVSAEAAITLAPGDHSVADLSPEVEKLFPVTGVVTGFGESRGVSFRVETPSGGEFNPASRFIARTGEYRVMLPAGTYEVTATAYMRQGPMEARHEITVPQGPVGGVSFVMEPYASIPVDVETDATSQSNDGTSQTSGQVPQTNFGSTVSLTSANGEGFTPFLSPQPARRPGGNDPGSGIEGPLVIENVSPGRYVLRANPPSPWYVASASCGGVDLTHDELVVGGSSVGCSIHVVLRNDSGSAQVAVRNADQNPTSGQGPLYVYAVPEGNLAQQVVMLNRQNGQYSAEGMAPGRYLVLALDHREELPYRDPAAMRRYAGLGQEISVTPNGKADIEVSLATGAQ